MWIIKMSPEGRPLTPEDCYNNSEIPGGVRIIILLRYSEKELEIHEVQSRAIALIMKSEVRWITHDSGRWIIDCDRLLSTFPVLRGESWLSGLFYASAGVNSAHLESAIHTPKMLRAQLNLDIDSNSERPEGWESSINGTEDDEDGSVDGNDTAGTHSAIAAGYRLGSACTLTREAGPREQALNVAEYANALADLFGSAKDNEQFCFGLFGHWGRGKTFLMNAAGELLQAKGYVKVQFSAWKYRTTPEVWVHLYETVLDAARKDNLTHAIRAGLVRVGPWPAIGAVFSLFLALITFGQKIETLRLFMSLIGVIGLMYYGLLYFKIRSFVFKISSHYVGPASHAEKLGLQAAIGLDMRALLIGWMPRTQFALQAKAATLLPLVTYLLAVTAVGCQIWVSLSPVPIFARISSVVSWGVAMIVAPYVIIKGFAGPKRLLLVVDDLDRCHPAQMLEIIESVMLLLDDVEINSRMQVAMLVEEATLEVALAQKYRFLIDKEMRSDTEDAYDLDRIVRENIEKIFLVHLRLPPASDRGLSELMEKFVEQLCEPLPITRNAEDPVQVPPSEVMAPAPAEGDRSSHHENRKDFKFTLSRDERDQLVQAVGYLRGSSYAGTWGPRSVRCFLFRYQLARLLLSRLGIEVTPDRLVGALVKAQSDAPTGTELSEEAILVEEIATQVS